VLHGFTQTGRLFGRFGVHVAESHSLVAIDLPGHAASESVHTDLPETATLVAESVHDTIGDEPCDLFAYSLGARVALHVLTGTNLEVSRAVLVGATGGIEDAADRERRRLADETRAAELAATGDVDRFLDEWLAGPMFDRLAASDAAELSERRRNSATGLASSLRLCGVGAQEPLWDRLAALPCPILAIAGADDTRFAVHALRIARLAPHAVASLVPGGGHAAHLSQPDQAARIVDHWLAAVEPSVI
jgi:2-succinyl-6-hydroxy-2,4-cyclohexadiene-1-carboxylate synthase